MTTTDWQTLLDGLANDDLGGEDRERLQRVLKQLVLKTLDRLGREQLRAEVDDAHGREEAKERLEDPDQVVVLAPLYCDRILAGIDSWGPEEQDKWIEVCQIVTELTSSVVH
jgi:hypothetical protein